MTSDETVILEAAAHPRAAPATATCRGHFTRTKTETSANAQAMPSPVAITEYSKVTGENSQKTVGQREAMRPRFIARPVR
jgi:hypothetical protein